MARESTAIVELRHALGQRLAAFRKAAELTQSDVARQTAYHRSTIAHIETGRARADERFWQAADDLTSADGALVAAYRHLEAKTHEHEIRARRAALTQACRQAETAPVPVRRAFDAGLVYSASLAATVDAVADLGRHDMERRRFLSGALFTVAASIAPSRDWLLATLDEAGQTARKIGSNQVDAIRRTFGVFQELDVMRGGGHARHQLAGYFTSHLVPLLRSNDPSTGNGRALYESAAEQLYLLGWMAFDNGEHSLAQRYLIQSLRLAQECGRPELGAHVLAGMSDQATLTGSPDQGAQLAKAGRAGLARGHSPACLADLYALEARAEAAMGNAEATARNVSHSEKAFANVNHDEEPAWARFIDVAYLNGEYAHAFRDLQRPREASEFAGRSIADAKRQGRARRGSLAHAAQARAALDAHDLQATASAAITAATLGATVQSSRSLDAVNDLRIRLRKHRKSPAVREFMEVSSVLMPSLAPVGV
ncbi:helix-turn-helix transcriptional regulator [Saccharopolyspora spinosa]|uniref:helix-turn-helix domain-containing protein n=1 Tax=Saccharopolyspora spinosa TaxID=60894 RepID=UPI001659B0E6|nr:helix-turn-helix transcriptional regulator [Saccharopolyspora spinosa]